MKTYLVLHKDDLQTSNATTFFLFRHIERHVFDSEAFQIFVPIFNCKIGSPR